MVNKHFCLIFNHFEQEHLGKDVFLIPYYWGKKNHYDVSIAYPITDSNKFLPLSYKGVRLLPLKSILLKKNDSFSYFMKAFIHLLCNSRKIDVLMTFHYRTISVLLIIIYKLLNPKGKAYLKADGVIDVPRHILNYRKCSVKRWLYTLFVNKIDVLSCETSSLFTEMNSSKSIYLNLLNKVTFVPNGFDEAYFDCLNMKERMFSEKENLIITVGRLGSYPKNTEMFLRALETVDLKDWKVCFIGTVEKSFEIIISDFFRRYPEKKEVVMFTGPIYEKKILWEYYNRAKVFVLTSEWESYALVLNEAKRFRNYLVSTNVGAFQDLVEGGKYGQTISQNSSQELSKIINDVTNGKLNIDVYGSYVPQELFWENIVEKLKLDN